MMVKKLKQSIKKRLLEEISDHNPVKFLKTLDLEVYFPIVIQTVYLYTRVKRGTNKSIYMAEMITAIGHAVRNKYKLKRDSSLAAKAGAFLLYSFEEAGLIQIVMGQSSNSHGSYIVQVLDDPAICGLWSSLEAKHIEKLPSEVPYAPFTSTRHESGAILIKTGNKEVLAKVKPETHPMIYEVINRKLRVGWRVNEDVYKLHSWALRTKTKAFADIWDSANPEAKATKMREATAIGEIAKRFLHKTFWHNYYFDFRGRLYPATAYFHEQGSDLARGMLLRDLSKPITKAGFFWLMISIASTWAGDSGRPDKAKTDKIPLKDRFAWAMENEDTFLDYAADPKRNQGWMDADKPWQFIAACIELKKLREYQSKLFFEGDGKAFENYDYLTHLECFVDGSNNGSQHLAALSKDEITAPLVNLVPQPLPGDLYRYVADHVWDRLEKSAAQMPQFERDACEAYVDKIIELKKRIQAADQNSPERAALIDEIKEEKLVNAFLADKACIVYWLRVKDLKHRRKICKRNVMTLPYGGTSFGLGQQQIDDAKKHGIELLLYLEHRWAAFLGRKIYEDCKDALEKPMKLLKIFEEAGRKAEEEGRFLSWTVPITHFPVVQNYTEGKVKRLWIQYGPPKGARKNTGYYENTLQLHICHIEDAVPSKRKQAQGASPNAIHSLDAAHLTMTCYQAPFDVTTIHDSFGCLLPDMPELFNLVRKTFVELYATDPLTAIMMDIGGDLSAVEIGSLDLTLVLDSEFCFI